MSRLKRVCLEVILSFLIAKSASGRYLATNSSAKLEDIGHLKGIGDLCRHVDLELYTQYFCCEGRVLPKNRYRFKCLNGQPYKRTKTKIKCDQKTLIVSKYSKKYGCCGHRRYKKSRLICYRGSTFKPLEIPCQKGFQPKAIYDLSLDIPPSYACERCPDGFYSPTEGLEKCQKCTGKSCRSYRTGVLDRKQKHKGRGKKKPIKVHGRKKVKPSLTVVPAAPKSPYDISRKVSYIKPQDHHSTASWQSLSPDSWQHRTIDSGQKYLKHPSTLSLPQPSIISSSDTVSLAYRGGLLLRKPLPNNVSHDTPFGIELNDTGDTPIELEENDPVPVSVSRLPFAAGLSIAASSFFVTSFGVVVLIVKRKRCKSSASKGDVEQRAPPDQDLNNQLCNESDSFLFDYFTNYHDDFGALDIAATKKAMPRKYTNVAHHARHHRRSNSDSVIILSCGRDSLSLHFVEGAESLCCKKRNVKPLDAMSLDVKYFPNTVPSSFSSNDISTVSTASVTQTQSLMLKKSLSLMSIHDVFSTLATNALKYPTFLPTLISKIEKSTSFRDVNVTDSLYKEQCTQTSLKKMEHKNLLGGGWDRGGSFDHNGGTLEKPGSSVSVVIPDGAVDISDVAKIHGKVFTNLRQFTSIFRLQQGERFVSPVVEFVESNGINFRKHMIVKIPIPQGYGPESSLVVHCVPGKGDLSVKPVPRADKLGIKPDVYFDVKADGFVYVYAKHFTAFVCSSPERSQIHLNGLVLRQIEQNSSAPSQTVLPLDVKLRLYICDCLYLIKDFRTAFEDRVAELGWKRMDEKTIQLKDPAHEDDELSMIVQLSDLSKKNWKEKTRSDGVPVFDNPNKKISEIAFIAYEMQAEFPEIGGEWVFTSQGVSPFFECVLDVEHIIPPIEHAQHGLVRSSKRRITTFHLNINTEKSPQNQTTYAHQKLDEKFCTDLANELHLADVRQFARYMGVGDTKTGDIFSNHPDDGHECKYRVVQKCLQTLGPDVFRRSFPEALTSIGRLDVAQKLGGQRINEEEAHVHNENKESNHVIETDV